MYDLSGRWTAELYPPGVAPAQLVTREPAPLADDTMLKRVTQAIAEQQDRVFREQSRLATDRELAIAALRALRDPTPAMIEAALAIRVQGNAFGLAREWNWIKQLARLRASIDSALNGHATNNHVSKVVLRETGQGGEIKFRFVEGTP